MLVDDAIAALQELARRVYAAWNRPVVGITGSAARPQPRVNRSHSQQLRLAGAESQRNYKQQLGLPLALLQMVSQGPIARGFQRGRCWKMGMSTLLMNPPSLSDKPPDVGVELIVSPGASRIPARSRTSLAKAETD